MQVGQVVFAKNENDLLKLCSEISIRFLGDSSNIISVYYYFFFFCSTWVSLVTIRHTYFSK